MTAELLVLAGLIYVVVDLITAFVYGRCVLPFATCRHCRKD